MDALLTLVLLLAAGIAYSEWAKRRAITLKLRRYAQQSEPIIEYSRHPTDSEVDDRVREHLEWLEKSGNTIHKAGRQLVFVLHYNSVAGDERNGHIGAFISWNHYLISLGKFTEKISNDFADDVRRHDSDAYVAWHLKQKRA